MPLHPHLRIKTRVTRHIQQIVGPDGISGEFQHLFAEVRVDAFSDLRRGRSADVVARVGHAAALGGGGDGMCPGH